MSARLVKAMRAGKVVLQNRTNAEVAIRFVDHEGNRAQRQIGPRGELELSPKHTPVNRIKFSNVKDLIRRRVIRIANI